MKENEYEIDGVWYQIKPNEMEFIDEIATQITEERFGDNTYVDWANLEKTKENAIKFTEKAQDFYNERYDEVESLYINLIKK
tara:strand:+ start:1988 stop:2233 length:246 start_codon:yes stop_codon:yes gene_type:complete